jgi:hypothetical protein
MNVSTAPDDGVVQPDLILEGSARSIPVLERLQDEERSGKPAKFTTEQVVELLALGHQTCRNRRTNSVY